MISPEKIKSFAVRYAPEVIEIRRHLHQHPELSFEEFKTAEYITEILKRHHIPFETGIAGTGIIARIRGKNPESKTFALRADMDALPIVEANDVPYCSVVAGVMHACGHDVHTACLLGAAMILNQTKSEWEGTARLIFQPGEEKLPGGATLMIKEGVLENPVPDFIVGQHVFPELQSGKAGFRKGMYMASTDELYVTIKGKGGHAALPGQYINPVIVAAEILMELNKEFTNESTRNIPSDIPTILAFGKIHANGATNIIPEDVKMEGTFRTMNEAWRKQAHDKMKFVAGHIAKSHNAEVDFEIRHGYPYLVNDNDITEKFIEAAKKYLGDHNVVELETRMTAEDFAWYSQVIPACFYRLGTRNEAKGIVSSVHTPTFDIDEHALETGMGLMAFGALYAAEN